MELVRCLQTNNLFIDHESKPKHYCWLIIIKKSTMQVKKLIQKYSRLAKFWLKVYLITIERLVQLRIEQSSAHFKNKRRIRRH